MPTRPPLIRVDRDGAIPAAFVQEERLRFGRGIQMPNTTSAMGLRFTGDLDVAALERAVGLLVQRQETLRLTFRESPAGARIVVTDGQAIGLRRLSVENESPSRRMPRGLDLLAREAEVQFDLARGPLFRAVLIRLSDTEHLLGLYLDKILVDRNSCVILQRDLLALYRRAAGLADAGLPELPLQFADYAAWERSYLRGAALDRLLEYWRTTLKGVDAIPDVGLVDPAAPRGATPGLATHARTVPAELVGRLEAAARDESASLFVALSSALKAVIHVRRRTVMDPDDAADVAVFGSMANRGHRALKDVVGYLATYAVFRTDLTGDPTPAALMERETRTVFGALCHQEIPHPLIVRALSPHQYGVLHRFRETDVPHFLHFDMDDDWTSVLRQTGPLRVRAVRVPVAEVPGGWLRLIARRMPDGLSFQLRYRTDFYSASWAESFLGDYVNLLRLWPEQLDRRLSDVG